MFLRATATFLLLVAFAFPMSAQTPSGEISGVISDSNGSVVAGVRITLTNSATNAVREVQSNDSGLYAIPALPPGIYTLKVEKTGFRAVERRNIEVLVGSANRIDVTLEVGEVANTVEITGGAPVLQSENASIGTVIENRSIVELPLNVSGQRIHFNHYSLDGIENTDLNFNSYMLLPSVDALQEFKVESGLFDAEYGRAIAQINVSTKSGTNQFHGTLFEFLRNSALDAKNYFDRPAPERIPPFKRNQYGATVSGPPSLPLKAWRGGDFSRALGAPLCSNTAGQGGVCGGAFNNPIFVNDTDGNRVQQREGMIFDPTTRTFNGPGDVIGLPRQFKNNIIPQNSIHEVSKKLLAFFPLPQQERTGSNFVNNEARRIDADQYTYRVDFTESSKSNWFYRHSISHELGYDPFAVPNMGINTDTDVQQGVLANTRAFGSNKVNDVRLGLSRLVNAHISPRANTVNVVKELGINIPSDNPLYWGVPNINITGLSGLGEESDAPFINYDTTIQLVDNFSWTLGRHSWKFGAEVRRVRYNQIGGVVTRGSFAFDGRYTQKPQLLGQSAPAAVEQGGAAFADFLLGNFNRAEGQVGAPIANFRSNYFALYLQDNWKITPKLTLNYGLRWENDQPFRDKYDAIVNIDFRWDNSMEPVYVRAGEGDPYEGNPAFRLAPDIKYVRDGRFGDRAYQNDLNDFAPRLGVAYQITPKTVLRAGAGIYYVRDIGNATFDIVRNAPFTIRRDEPAENFRPNLSFERPFARTGAPTFILINQFNERTSYVAQWSFGLQRELTGSMTVEATYFGSAGIKLRRLQTYNQTRPSQLANSNLSRPFPKFGGFQVMNAPSHSSYHALYLKAQQRFSRGLTFISSFAWGKSIDNGSGIRTSDGDSLTPSNDYNLELERGLSAFDFRRRWTSSWVWELPVGRGKRWLSENRIADFALGGWQLGGILTLQDGFPFTVTCGPGNIQNGGGICYPDSTGANPNLPRDQQTRTRFFNTDAYIDRIPANGPFRFGNSARNSVMARASSASTPRPTRSSI